MSEIITLNKEVDYILTVGLLSKDEAQRELETFRMVNIQSREPTSKDVLIVDYDPLNNVSAAEELVKNDGDLFVLQSKIPNKQVINWDTVLKDYDIEGIKKRIVMETESIEITGEGKRKIDGDYTYEEEVKVDNK